MFLYHLLVFYLSGHLIFLLNLHFVRRIDSFCRLQMCISSLFLLHMLFLLFLLFLVARLYILGLCLLLHSFGLFHLYLTPLNMTLLFVLVVLIVLFVCCLCLCSLLFRIISINKQIIVTYSVIAPFSFFNILPVCVCVYNLNGFRVSYFFHFSFSPFLFYSFIFLNNVCYLFHYRNYIFLGSIFQYHIQ